MSSKIEWCDETWNPIIGCSKVSPGCANCYAEKMAFRQANMRPGCEYERVIKTGNLALLRPEWNGKTAFVESAIDKPLHWRKPRRIFVCSMGDLFHDTVTREMHEEVFSVMSKCRQHTFLLLTKRPERMDMAFGHRVLPNVHIGVSAETQEQADKRIPILLQIPAAVRFVSIEPMLGPVSLVSPNPHAPDMVALLHHVIVGGESGTGARPMHPDWARSLRDQCVAAGVPFLFKQWGEWAPNCLCDKPGACRTTKRPDPGLPGVMFHCGKHEAGRALDGRTWDQYPEVKA